MFILPTNIAQFPIETPALVFLHIFFWIFIEPIQSSSACLLNIIGIVTVNLLSK